LAKKGGHDEPGIAIVNSSECTPEKAVFKKGFVSLRDAASYHSQHREYHWFPIPFKSSILSKPGEGDSE
jgi:hypothetical protein